MDPPMGYPSPENPSPSSSTRRENQIQGPRPSPLRVSKDSHKIGKKPPIAPPQRPPQPPQQPPLHLPENGNQPIIIYSVSPKPIFVEASNFRSIVQHLTGKDSSGGYESSFSGEVPVSPAARVAAIERTSPKEGAWRERRVEMGGFSDEILMGAASSGFNGGFGGGFSGGERNFGFEGVEMSQNPGILSPSPVNLPAISAAMFSPAVEMNNQIGFGFGDLIMSPLFGATMSPSTMFLSNASTFFSSSPSSLGLGELFNFDF